MWCRGSLLFAVLVLVPVCSILPASGESREKRETHRETHRERRDTVYWVDVMVLVDWDIYLSWYGRTQATLSMEDRKQEALTNIKTYFTVVIREVSDLYSGLGTSFRLHFRPVGFYMETQEMNQWVSLSPTGLADADQTITKVVNWLKANAQVSQFDHAVLFTGKDLATDNEGHTTGRGTTGTLCSGHSYDSVSVIEDRGAFQSVFTLAHELGHSLNAAHDGTNGCSGNDRYIMASSTYDVTESNRRHPWRFSGCSRNEINSFVNSLTPTQISSCLETSLPQDSDVPDVTGVVPGQLYDRDTQCRHLYGPQSQFCFFGDLSTICTWMPCKDPSKIVSRSCNVHLAATGTTCGDKKWCQAGACVDSPNAPAVESCDTDQAVLVNGRTCSAMAEVEPIQCYDMEVFTNCCRSCQNANTGAPGCPYGNKKTGCTSDLCQKILNNGDITDEDCCRTCDFDASTWSCQDVDSIDGETCAEAVRRRDTQGCYNWTLAFHCCATCQNLRSLERAEGCEYGDRVLQGCRRPANTRDRCDVKACCLTCATPTGTGTTQRPLHPLSLLLLAVLIPFHCCPGCYHLS